VNGEEFILVPDENLVLILILHSRLVTCGSSSIDYIPIPIPIAIAISQPW